MWKRSQRRFTGWLVVAAVTLQLFGPWVSQALAALDGTPQFWQQVCTVHGAASLPVSDPAPSPTQGDAIGATEHCPFCLLHLAHWVPTPQASPAIFTPGGTRPAPQPPIVAAQAATVWTSPPSRGPPALC